MLEENCLKNQFLGLGSLFQFKLEGTHVGGYINVFLFIFQSPALRPQPLMALLSPSTVQFSHLIWLPVGIPTPLVGIPTPLVWVPPPLFFF